MPSDLDHVQSIVKRDSLAVTATLRPDGTIHASVVNAGVVEDPVTGEARVGFVARGDAHKLAHLRASGRATVVFRHGPDWVAVEGPAQLVGAAGPDRRLRLRSSSEADPGHFHRRRWYPPGLGRVRPGHGGRRPYRGPREPGNDQRQPLSQQAGTGSPGLGAGRTFPTGTSAVLGTLQASDVRMSPRPETRAERRSEQERPMRDRRRMTLACLGLAAAAFGTGIGLGASSAGAAPAARHPESAHATSASTGTSSLSGTQRLAVARTPPTSSKASPSSGSAKASTKAPSKTRGPCTNMGSGSPAVSPAGS